MLVVRNMQSSIESLIFRSTTEEQKKNQMFLTLAIDGKFEPLIQASFFVFLFFFSFLF